MSALIRWNPIREMARTQDLVERLFEEGFLTPGYRRNEMAGLMPVDVYETQDEYVVRSLVAGVKPENIEITYENGVLTIRGEITEEKEVEGQRLIQELGYGRFARSISLPTDVKADQIQANLKDGVLTLHVPKAEETKPRKIEVKQQ